MQTARARHYQSLLERICGQSLPSDELAQAAVDNVVRSMSTEVATLYAYDRRADQLVLVATHGLNRSAIGYVTLKPGQGMSGAAFSSGEAQFRADVRQGEAFFNIASFDQHRYLSLLAVPVPLNGEFIGALNVQSLDPRQYQPRDIQELSEIAELIGPLLDRLWRGDLAARIRGSSALARMDGLLAGRFGRSVVAERLADQLHLLFPERHATVALLGADGSVDTFGAAPTERVQGILDDAASTQFESGEPRMDEFGGILAQMRTGSRVVGAFYIALGGGVPGQISSAANRLLGELGAQVASALHAAPDVSTLGDADRTVSVQQELIQMVLDGAGLESLLARAAELCGGGLAVTDRMGVPVAGTMKIAAAGVNVPLTVEGIVLGRLLAASEADPGLVTSAVAQAAALELSKWKLRFDIETDLRGDALDSLLAVHHDPRESAARAQMMGFDTARRYLPILFGFDSERLAANRGTLVLRSMLATTQRTFGAPPACLSFSRPEGVLVLVDEATLPRGPIPTAAQALADLRVTAAGALVSAGVGPSAPMPEHLSHTIIEARLAADLGLRLGAPAPIDASQLGNYRLFLGVESRERIQEFVDSYIGVLLDHDARQGTQFVRTLEAFHAHGENPRLAAASLFMHANTLKYRLGRIEALTGRELKRVTDRFNIYLALYALRYLDPDRHSLLPNEFVTSKE